MSWKTEPPQIMTEEFHNYLLDRRDMKFLSIQFKPGMVWNSLQYWGYRNLDALYYAQTAYILFEMGDFDMLDLALNRAVDYV